MHQGSVGVETPEASFSNRLYDKNKGEVFKYWAIVRGCHQEFWLVSSAFSPAVLMIVTTCVAVVAAKAISRQSLLHRSKTSSALTLCFQCAFIVTGWVILIWRWAVFLFFSVSREAEFFVYREYTEVCVNRFFRLVRLSIKKARNWSPRGNDGSWWKPIVSSVWKPLRMSVFFISLVAILPIALFFAVLCFLVFFNFFCWWFSKLLALTIAKYPHSKYFIKKIRDWVSDAEVELKTDAEENFYVAESSAKQLTEFVEADDEYFEKVVEAVKHSEEESRKWIRDELINPSGDIYCHIGKWKMVAVALISILAELNCCVDCKENVLKDDVEAANKGYSNETMKKDLKTAVKAYWGPKNLLAFLDFRVNITMSPMDFFHSGNSRAYQMSLEADIKMQEIEKWVEMEGHRPAALATFKEVKKVIEELKWRKECEFYQKTEFSQHWTSGKHLGLVKYFENIDILKISSMKCVCETICKESYQDSKKGLAMRCLGDIIACAVLELPEVLLQKCGKWAEELKEENLIKTHKIQDKCIAVKEKYNLKWKRKRSKITFSKRFRKGNRMQDK